MIRTRYFILTHHTKSQTLPSMPLKLFRSRNVLSMYCSKLRWDASSIMHHFKWPSCGIGQSRQASISTNWIIWSDIWSYLKIDEKISISLVWPRKQLSEIWDSAWIFKQCLAARIGPDPDLSSRIQCVFLSVLRKCRPNGRFQPNHSLPNSWQQARKQQLWTFPYNSD